MNVKRPPRNMQPLPLGSQATPIRHLDRHTPWSVPISATVTIVNEPPYRSIYVSGVFQSRFHLARPADERYALVMLVEGKFITQCRLADAYGYDHDTINNWVRRYRDFGAAGLLRINPGRLNPPPAEPAMTTGSAGPEQMKLELALPEGDPVPVPAAAGPPGADLPSSPGAESPPGEAASEAVLPPAERAVLTTGTAHPTRYAGILLALPFLQAVMAPVLHHVTAIQDQFHGFRRLWRIQDLLLGLALFFFAGVPNLERTKALFRREWGILMARRQAPSCRTLRRNIAWLTAGNLPKDVPRLVARQLLALGWVQPGEWQMDGHFVPYHGQGKLPKGWWPQRREGQRGHHQHWVSDRRGRPLFVVHHQGFAAFAHVIPDLVREAMALKAEHHPKQKPGTPMLFVFDRGGYSAELFTELDRISAPRQAVFVSWKKYHRPLPEAAFAGAPTLTFGQGKAQRAFQYVQTHVQVRHYHEQVYALVLREPKSGRQMTLITNADRVAPGWYSDPDLVAPLLRRWALENYFKVAKHQHGLDQILGHHLVEPGDEDWPVPNPQYVQLKRRLATVAPLLAKAQRDVEQLKVRFQALQKKPCWPRFLKQKRNRKIQQRYQALQAESNRICAALTQTPVKVPYRQLHTKAIQGLELDRADVVTTLRAVAFHLRAQLSDLAASCFPDVRERSKFIDSLIHASGTYQRLPDRDVVTIKAHDTPAYQRAAATVVDQLNAMVPQALDGSGRIVQFRLEKS